MRVLGKTRFGRIVATNENMDRDAMADFYRSFTAGDHYDAACIWVLHSFLDHMFGYKNVDFHLSFLGKDRTMIVGNVKQMAKMGRKLKDDWRQTANN